jgi:hypothetical protein
MAYFLFSFCLPPLLVSTFLLHRLWCLSGDRGGFGWSIQCELKEWERVLEIEIQGDDITDQDIILADFLRHL